MRGIFDPVGRDVAHGRRPDERQQVVFAQREKRYTAQDDHFVGVLRVERGEPGQRAVPEKFLVEPRHPTGRVGQAFAGGIMPKQLQEFADQRAGPGDTRPAACHQSVRATGGV